MRGLQHVDRPFRRPFQLVATLIILCALSACGFLGPASISTERGSYIDVLAQTDREELLGNLVRLKYSEPPVFLQVGSITASPSLELGVEGEVNLGNNVPPPSVVAKPNIVYKDAPTIVYAPLSGTEFATEILTPMGLPSVYLMLENGFAFDVIADLMLVSINGLSNARDAPAAERAMFRQAATAFTRLIAAGLVQSGTVESGGELEIAIDLAGAAGTADGDLVARAWGLDLSAGQIRVERGLGGGASVLSVRTRSLLAIMSYLSNSVEAPAAHASQVWPSPGDPDPPMRVRVNTARPAGAAVAVRQRGHWFYVAADDLKSLNALYLLRVLFNLQAQASGGQIPQVQLTLPVQ
ncbi:MAG: hypothetical protein ACMVY4_03700 [Minwuia sp.]|uniref:hypothetical protein n=1 Tax=Minwuia sp. TaxID=2493630 RepID=UPI003A88AB4E